MCRSPLVVSHTPQFCRGTPPRFGDCLFPCDLRLAD
jgi:hypothetical protein